MEITETKGNTITAKIFLNINLSIEIDHVVVTARYTLIPENEIKYEVINGLGEGIIRNSVVVRGRDTVGAKEVYSSAVDMNHIPLDLMCYPPPFIFSLQNKNHNQYIFSPEGERIGEYQRMINYFVQQDSVALEKKDVEGFKIGQLCNKCKRGHLQMTGEREDTGIKKTDFFRCDYCGSEFKNIRAETSDGISLY
jgi:hypothetical protein